MMQIAGQDALFRDLTMRAEELRARWERGDYDEGFYGRLRDLLAYGVPRAADCLTEDEKAALVGAVYKTASTAATDMFGGARDTEEWVRRFVCFSAGIEWGLLTPLPEREGMAQDLGIKLKKSPEERYQGGDFEALRTKGA